MHCAAVFAFWFSIISAECANAPTMTEPQHQQVEEVEVGNLRGVALSGGALLVRGVSSAAVREPASGAWCARHVRSLIPTGGVAEEEEEEDPVAQPDRRPQPPPPATYRTEARDGHRTGSRGVGEDTTETFGSHRAYSNESPAILSFPSRHHRESHWERALHPSSFACRGIPAPRPGSDAHQRRRWQPPDLSALVDPSTAARWRAPDDARRGVHALRRFFTARDCARLIAAAEAHGSRAAAAAAAAEGANTTSLVVGWSTHRHDRHATTDVPLSLLGDAGRTAFDDLGRER